jgi:hypothetical protein
MNWHYVKDNTQTGPVDQATLEALFRAGTINASTLVWSPGMETWLPYSEALPGPPPAIIGKEKLSEGVEPVTVAMRYAGFWIRFAAKFVDGIIMSVLVVVPMIAIMASMGMFERSSEEPSEAEIIVQLVFQIVYVAVYGAYSIFFVGKYGAPAKWPARSRWWTKPAQRLDTDVRRGGSSQNSLAASFVTSATSWLLLTRKSAPCMTESAILG